MACLGSGGSRENVNTLAPPPQQQKSIVQIYTDWANHYLERSRYKRYIQDLQSDVCDGVLLADVIDAVAGAKVPDINRKPKTNSQMVDNITACLAFLGTIGVATEGVTAKDIREGNLKAILGLFFCLSRYKQAQKAARSPLVSTPPGNHGSHNHKNHLVPSTRPSDLMASSTHLPNSHSKLPSLQSTKTRVKDALTCIPAPMGTLQRRTPTTTDNKNITSSSKTPPSSTPSPVALPASATGE